MLAKEFSAQTIEPPVSLEFAQGKLGICGMFSEVVKRMENTKFSRIFRFVRLLVNEAFLPWMMSYLSDTCRGRGN